MLHSVARILRSRSARWSLAAVMFVCSIVTGVRAYQLNANTVAGVGALRYSELLAALRQGRVDSILIQPGANARVWLAPGASAVARVVAVEYGQSQTDAVVAAATEANVGIRFATPARSKADTANLIATLFVALGLGALLYTVAMRQSGGGAASVDVATNGKGGGSTTTFADVAGNKAAIQDLHEIVEFLRDPKKFAGMGARVPKGILLEGPPGTGKTLMARALAGEAGTSFFAASGPDFSGMFVGVGTMRVKSLFKKARKAGGGVIFIDEVDSLGGKRGRQGGHQEDDRTLNQLLVEMDGFGPSDGIIVVAATNRGNDLDPALLRKGRFDRAVTVSLPTTEERKAILALHAARRKMPLGADVELERLARLMPNASGADLEGLLNEAAILAVRSGAGAVSWGHIEEARDRVLLGRAREGFAVSDVERRVIALHEAGHAIAGLVFAPTDPLHKVTIQPRGGAMGVAFFQPDHETMLHSRAYLEGQLRKGLGGRAAEELIYGADRVTSGASSDLQHTTRVAKQMVYRLGMGVETGLMIFDPESGPVSEELHARMDKDVRALLDQAYSDVKTLLSDERSSLEALADALLERETLSGGEAAELLRATGFFERTSAAA